ncbi:hypothetical protein R3P38DRAFT_3042258, partial [Favolaschia claudopus]
GEYKREERFSSRLGALGAFVASSLPLLLALSLLFPPTNARMGRRKEERRPKKAILVLRHRIPLSRAVDGQSY